jgi:hypothetical protein
LKKCKDKGDPVKKGKKQYIAKRPAKCSFTSIFSNLARHLRKLKWKQKKSDVIEVECFLQ